jgi:hypothetical protein
LDERRKMGLKQNKNIVAIAIELRFFDLINLEISFELNLKKFCKRKYRENK